MGDQQRLSDTEFKAELEKAIPHLRAFGHSIAGDADVADDLVQETMLKAWTARQRFIAGTSMRAWTFVILRNTFRSSLRKKTFSGPNVEAVMERILSAPASQQDSIHLADLRRALMELPHKQREAVILVGAGGYSYQEAADIMGCAIGTIKSRLSRARERLLHVLDNGRFMAASEQQNASDEDPLDAIMMAVEELAS